MNSVIRRAFEEDRKIQIIYLSGKGELTQRYVKVINMNETHFTGYCFLKKQRRLFKFDNLLSVAEVKKKQYA